MRRKIGKRFVTNRLCKVIVSNFHVSGQMRGGAALSRSELLAPWPLPTPRPALHSLPASTPHPTEHPRPLVTGSSTPICAWHMSQQLRGTGQVEADGGCSKAPAAPASESSPPQAADACLQDAVSGGHLQGWRVPCWPGTGREPEQPEPGGSVPCSGSGVAVTVWR